MKAKALLGLVLTGALCASSYAGTMGEVLDAHDWNWVGTVSAGPVWEKAGKTQTFYLTPTIEKSYVADKQSQALFDGELFLGVQKGYGSMLNVQLGVAGGITSDARLSGVIWDDADPQFNNYSYQYRVMHGYVAVKSKVLVEKGYFVTPWVSGSLGVGFNQARGFTNTPLIYEAVANSNFSEHTQTAFTYTVGAGIQKALDTHLSVGIGYEFSDWGKSQLGLAQGQTLGKGLSLNHLYTNGFLINLSYVR